MAFTYRGKRHAYDNIAVGSQTGREKIVVAGDTTPGETTRLTLDQRGSSTSGLSQGHPENVVGYTNTSGVSQTSRFVDHPSEGAATSAQT